MECLLTTLSGNGAIPTHHPQVCSLLPLWSHRYLMGNHNSIQFSCMCVYAAYNTNKMVIFRAHSHVPNSMLTCICVCPLQMFLIVACIIGVIAYRLAVFAAFASIMKDSSTSKIATSVTASLINFVIIMILNFFYERVAIWITDLGKGLITTGSQEV